MTEKTPDFMETLENGIKDVLTNKKTSMKDRINAINAGTKLMLIKHKIEGSGDEAGGFFNNKGK